MFGDHFGDGVRDLFGLQLSDLLGLLLGDEACESSGLLPGEELEVAVGVFFSGNDGLRGRWQEGRAVFVGELGFRSELAVG